ncbi:MAG: lipoyl synthase [Endomicrobiales bacterium]|nr:lipoyl synthase [Endomicrobiales bacterium]
MVLIRKKKINLSHLSELKKILRETQLNTVCEDALCPNIGECFHRGTAAFLIAGKLCTRKCRFCSIKKGVPLSLDPQEPQRIAETVKKLGLKYAVITSVTRDDLPDGAAGHFVKTMECIVNMAPETKVEVLVPDFMGRKESIDAVIAAKPFVFNHNLETVPRLYPVVRPEADYLRSLGVIETAKKNGLTAKSGLMAGLGENESEVIQVMNDLRNAGCDMLTIGQYLAPSRKHYKVREYVKEEIFDRYKKTAIDLGFKHCASAPYVRSSYMADISHL